MVSAPRPRRRPRPRRGALLTALGAAVALSVPAAGTATAQVGDLGDYEADGVHLRSGPAPSYTSVGLGYRGQRTCMFHYEQGPSGSMHVWWYNANWTTSVFGYTRSDLIRVDLPYETCAYT